MTQKKSEDRRLGPGPSVSVPRWWFGALAVLVVAPWLVAGAIYMSPSGKSGALEHAAVAEGPGRSAAAGPWGELTTFPIVISPPLELVTVDWGPVRPPTWFLPGVPPEGTRGLLTSSGISDDAAAGLSASARPDPRIGGSVLTPDPAWLRQLDSTARARLYMLLSKTSLNREQAESFRYRGQSVDAWLGASLISPETRRLVEPLVYRDGDYLHFADVELIRSEIGDAEELRRLAKGLLRQPTVVVKLAVRDDAEINGLAEYWGRGGRRTDVRPLLESVAGGGPDRSIDIVHLLPAFARNYLYRYPRLSAADFDRPVLANCLWTALNFFEPHPDDRFLDVNTALATLKADYYVVESGFELGDVIAFLDASGNIFHAAVYLADDLVFSKNGTSPMAPWSIMSIAELTGYYRTRSEAPRLILHRRNDY